MSVMKIYPHHEKSACSRIITTITNWLPEVIILWPTGCQWQW